ncbi:MAG: transposase [Puniceicoccales bacterium]|jgi:transposase|nr:transposase [Puniceicoccales bacterium]
MAKAYSLDLREKVMSFLSAGKKKREAMEVFGLSLKTIYRWIKRKEKGMLAESKNNVRKPRKLDPEKLREYIKNHPGETLKQIGTAFGANPVSVFARIRQLGISYERKSYYTRSEMKKSGEHSRNSLAKSK